MIKQVRHINEQAWKKFQHGRNDFQTDAFGAKLTVVAAVASLHVGYGCRRRKDGTAGVKTIMKPNSAAMPGGQKHKNRGVEPLGTNSEIGRKLKQYYDGLVSDDVPDRFSDLLKQLEERESDHARRDGE